MTTELAAILVGRAVVNGDCWEWQGSRNDAGYGIFQGRKRAEPGRTRLAHRLLWEEEHGPVPDGMVLDHLCRNRACINLAHLEVVTNAENLRRGLNGVLRIRCAEGHALLGDNLYVDPRGSRVCRTCKNAKWRAAWRRRKGGQ